MKKYARYYLWCPSVSFTHIKRRTDSLGEKARGLPQRVRCVFVATCGSDASSPPKRGRRTHAHRITCDSIRSTISTKSTPLEKGEQSQTSECTDFKCPFAGVLAGKHSVGKKWSFLPHTVGRLAPSRNAPGKRRRIRHSAGDDAPASYADKEAIPYRSVLYGLTAEWSSPYEDLGRARGKWRRVGAEVRGCGERLELFWRPWGTRERGGRAVGGGEGLDG